MSARRTELEVTVKIGEVQIPGGRLRVPATLEFSGGGSGTGGGGRGSRGGGGGGGERNTNLGGYGTRDTVGTFGGIGAAANIAGIFNSFGLRRQLFSLQGLLRGVNAAGVGGLTDAAQTARTAVATGELATAQAATATAAQAFNAALAQQARALEIDTVFMGQNATAAATLAEADAAVSVAAANAGAALQAEAAAAQVDAAANYEAATATQTFGAALWALVGPLIPFIAAFIALAGAVMVAKKAFDFLLQVLQVAETVIVTALQKMGEGAVWIGQQFVNLGEVILRRTIDILWEFANATVDAMGQARDAIVAFTQSAADVFATFEQEITNAVAITGQLGETLDASRQKLMDWAMAVASQGRYGANELATALYQIQSAVDDLSPQGLQAYTKAATDFAAATISDVEPAALSLTTTMNALNLSYDQASHVADVFTQAVNKSALQSKTLQDALRYALPFMSAYNLKLEDGVASLMAFAQAGYRGSQSGMYFRQVISALADPSEKAVKKFREMGSDVRLFSIGVTGSVRETIRRFQELESRIGKSRMRQLIGDAFETRAQAGLFTLINTGAPKLAQLQGVLMESGVAARTAAEQLNTLAGALKGLQNVWENAKIEVGSGGLSEGIRYVVLALRQLVVLASQAGVFREWGAVLRQVGGVLAWLVRELSGPAVEALQLMVRMLPDVVRQIGEAVAAIAPGLKDFLKWLPTLFKGALDSIVPAVLKFVTTTLPLLLQFAQMALPLMVDIFTKFVEIVTQFIGDNGGNLVAWFEAVLRSVLSLVQFLPQVLPVVTELVGAFVRLGPELLRTAIEALPALLTAVQSIIPYLVTLAETGINAIMTGMTYFNALLNSGVIPALQNYLNLLMQIMGWVQTNWPGISRLLAWGLWVAQQFVAAFGVSLEHLLVKASEFLSYLTNNWGPVFTNIRETIATIIDLLGVKWQGALYMLATKLWIFAAVYDMLAPIAASIVLIVGGMQAWVQAMYDVRGSIETTAKAWENFNRIMSSDTSEKLRTAAAEAWRGAGVAGDAAGAAAGYIRGAGPGGARNTSANSGARSGQQIAINVTHNVDPTKPPEEWLDVAVASYDYRRTDTLRLQGA